MWSRREQGLDGEAGPTTRVLDCLPRAAGSSLHRAEVLHRGVVLYLGPCWLERLLTWRYRHPSTISKNIINIP
jgi:hypothetical protein